MTTKNSHVPSVDVSLNGSKKTDVYDDKICSAIKQLPSFEMFRNTGTRRT